MATPFSVAKLAPQTISQEIAVYRERIKQGRDTIKKAKVGLAEMATKGWPAVVADVAANAAIPGWDVINTELSLLVNEFVAFQAAVAALDAAMNAIVTE